MKNLYSRFLSIAFLISGACLSSALNAKSVDPNKNIVTDNRTSTSTSKQVSFAGITANGDAARFDANGMEIDVIANDRINGTENLILSDVGTVTKNAKIETVGIWPTGIYLSATGKVIVVAGTIMPRKPLQYKITNLATSETSTASVILYDNSNKFTTENFYIWTEVDGTCYVNNANERTFTLHIVNIDSTPKTIAANDQTGYKFRINVTGADYDNDNTLSPEWTNPPGFWYYKALKNETIIQPFRDVQFKYKESNSIGDNTTVILTAIRYGNFSDNEIGATPGEAISFTDQDEIKIFKIPENSLIDDRDKTKDAYLGHNWTAQSVAGITRNLSGYKFYKSPTTGVFEQIPPTTPFPNTSPGTTVYYYAKVNSQGCENPEKVKLTVNVTTTSVTGGTIGISPSNLSEMTICSGSSIELRNITEGNADNLTSANLITYSWEVSENNGINWITLKDLPINENYNYPVTIPILKSINYSNIEKTIWLRRKTTSTYAPTFNEYAYSNTIRINVENKNINFVDGIKDFAIQKGSTFSWAGREITTDSGGTLEFLDEEDRTVTFPKQFNSRGSFTYSVKTTSTSGCEYVENFTINVYDLTDCTKKTVKTYATKAIKWTSGIGKTFYPDHATNSNNAAYATLTSILSVGGIGTLGVDLYFTKPDGTLYTPGDLKGKKVTLKLGEQYSGLKVAGGLSVIGRRTTATNPNDITLLNSFNSGKTYGVKGGILDLLKGDNTFEFSFTPKKFNGTNAEFNGVRVQLGSLLGVADLATVFYAYIEDDDVDIVPGTCNYSDIRVTPYLYNISAENATDLDDTVVTEPPLLYPATQKDINDNVNTVANRNILLNNFAEDATWGNRSEVLNVASALSSIVHPYFAIDNDYNSYTLFNSTVGVLNQQFLQVKLRQKAQPGDQIRLVLNYPNINLINLSLLQLGNFKLVYYLGDAVVGEDSLEQFRILDIGLFNFDNNKKAILAKPIRVPFDRVEIRQFQTINVNIGDGLRIYDIRIQPQMLFEGQTDPKQVTKICAAEPLGVQKPDLCTTYSLSLSKVTSWGNQLTDENGNLLYEADGTTPVYSIIAKQDIAGSNLNQIVNAYQNSGGNFTDYFEIPRMFYSDENNGILLLKIQAKRFGCDYGEPEYLRIRLNNCNEAMVNPIIRLMSSKP